MSQWPVIIVPGWEYLEPAFRKELAVDYSETGGRLVLIGQGPAELFQSALASADTGASTILTVDSVDDSFPGILKQALPEPMVRVTGSDQVDVSVRKLNGKPMVHLVNTSGPHSDPPADGISQISPIGPLTVAIRLAKAPRAILQQPQGQSLEVSWSGDRATVTLPKLELYSILVVEP